MKRPLLLLPLLALALPALAQDPATRSPAAEKTHAESAESAETESPLAAALARGDWIPVVVESVTIDTTVPRQLRKNWVVSFSGGVKARVHSPVKTFCASVGELPGKRFNVRFVDRAAATNALHGTIYSGELEVQPAQSPEDPATNASQSSRKEAVPTGVDVAAACRLLSQSRTATIHFISETTGKPIALPEDIQTKILAALGSARNGSFPTNAPLLGCRFRFAANDSFAAVESWFKAMGFIDFLSKDGAGNRIKANEQEELLFHAFRPLPDGDEAYVHVFGSSLSPGAPVAVVPGLGPLLESAATASQRPVEPEPPSPPSGPVAEKMKRIVLPIVDFRQSSVVDVVAELEDLARNHDDPIAAARGQGITFVLDIPSDATDSLPLVTCVMKSVSVYSALDMIAEMSGLEWRVDGDVIRLTLAQRRPAANETHTEAEDGVDGGCFGHAPSAEN